MFDYFDYIHESFQEDIDDVDLDLENIKDSMKKIQEKKSEFIGRAKRLHNIQDKYKKLSKSYPENYAGNDEVFINKIEDCMQ